VTRAAATDRQSRPDRFSCFPSGRAAAGAILLATLHGFARRVFPQRHESRLAFLLAARFLLDAMEPPEQKMARLRARRAKQAKKNGGKTPSKGDPAATRAVARSRTA